jgi:hypothetical protein
MENIALRSCSEYISKALSNRSLSLQSPELSKLLTLYSKLLNHYDQFLVIRVTALGRPCLLCGLYISHSSLSSAIALGCVNSHYFCTTSCLKTHSLSCTNGTLLCLQNVCCPDCCTPISVSLIEQAFEGRLQSLQSAACDRALSQLLDKENLALLKTPKFTCEICLVDSKVEDGITLDCDHRFCQACMQQHIALLIDTAQVTNDILKCPKCPQPLSAYEIEEVAGLELFLKYEKFVLRGLNLPELEEDEMVFRCPGTDCEYFCIVEKNREEVECPKCQHKCCPMCKDEIHQGATCEENRKGRRENTEEDKMLEALMEKEKLVRCPECRTVVQKVSGCKYMACGSSECRGKQIFFCYRCGVRLKENHQRHACKARWGRPRKKRG